MNIHDRLAYLLHQAANHLATDAELQELTDLLETDDSGSLTTAIASQLKADLPADHQPYDQAYWDTVADNILAADHASVTPMLTRNRYKRPMLLAAASLALLLLSGTLYRLLHRSTPPIIPVTASTLKTDVAPGGNKAILTLADGTQIPLDSSGNGNLAQQGNTTVIKLDSGQLAYRSAAVQTPGNILYNTITTPRGGQFRITLPDGSQVWLNASSSLRYPTAFVGDERKVELSGEAYFEVAKKAGMPFRIGMKAMEVEVLGTHFNIMAYDEEDMIRTTLLEGAVKVSNDGNSKRLLPGQQARVHKTDGKMDVQQDVNTAAAIAWKNGLTQFDGQDLKAAMQMIARWYNVEVEYRSTAPIHFRGVIPRNVPVSEVLGMMERTGEVHFSITGNKIIVLP